MSNEKDIEFVLDLQLLPALARQAPATGSYPHFRREPGDRGRRPARRDWEDRRDFRAPRREDDKGRSRGPRPGGVAHGRDERPRRPVEPEERIEGVSVTLEPDRAGM